VLDGSLFGGCENAIGALKGRRWKEVRAPLTPAFTSRKLKEVRKHPPGLENGKLENLGIPQAELWVSFAADFSDDVLENR
jgi:hypothetical protein